MLKLTDCSHIILQSGHFLTYDELDFKFTQDIFCNINQNITLMYIPFFNDYDINNDIYEIVWTL